MTIGWLFLWSLRQNARSAVLPSCPPSLGRGIWDSWPDEPRPTSKCVAKLIETKPADVDFARAPPRFYMDLYFVPATRALGLRYASCALPWWLISKNIQAIIRSAPVVSEKNGTRRQLIQPVIRLDQFSPKELLSLDVSNWDLPTGTSVACLNDVTLLVRCSCLYALHNLQMFAESTNTCPISSAWDVFPHDSWSSRNFKDLGFWRLAKETLVSRKGTGRRRTALSIWEVRF